MNKQKGFGYNNKSYLTQVLKIIWNENLIYQSRILCFARSHHVNDPGYIRENQLMSPSTLTAWMEECLLRHSALCQQFSIGLS